VGGHRLNLGDGRGWTASLLLVLFSVGVGKGDGKTGKAVLLTYTGCVFD